MTCDISSSSAERCKAASKVTLRIPGTNPVPSLAALPDSLALFQSWVDEALSELPRSYSLFVGHDWDLFSANDPEDAVENAKEKMVAYTESVAARLLKNYDCGHCTVAVWDDWHKYCETFRLKCNPIPKLISEPKFLQSQIVTSVPAVGAVCTMLFPEQDLVFMVSCDCPD